MASYLPPTKAAEYIFYISLFAQADNQVKTTPTIAAGDFKVSTDGGATSVTLVVQDTTGAIQTLVAALTDNYVPNTNLEDIYLYGAHDNEEIFLDTTTSGPANDTIMLQVEYWLET